MFEEYCFTLNTLTNLYILIESFGTGSHDSRVFNTLSVFIFFIVSDKPCVVLQFHV